MIHQEILEEFLSLPAEAQRQVVSLITFLKQQQIHSEHLSVNDDLMNDSFIGMWRDREDLDSTTWVRNLRKSEWSKTHD